MPILVLIFSFLLMMPMASAEKSLQSTVAIPGAKDGTGFDDINFSKKLKKVIIPGGGTGQVLLMDPATQEITPVGVLNPKNVYYGDHGQGVTSADEGDGFLFTIDRTAMTVNAWDVSANKVIASAPLASNPDYVRYVAFTQEVWVTQPDNARIEVFRFSDAVLKHRGFLAIPGGPEALIIDQDQQKAYTNLWKGVTVAIDFKNQRLESWSNGCFSSHGIALDDKRGFLFIGCSEGRIVVLDTKHNGKVLGTLEAGGVGIDVIGYNEKLSHVYLASGQSAKLSVVEISDKGVPELLGVMDVVKSSHCVTGDNADGIWVCDPDRGRILYFKDDF